MAHEQGQQPGGEWRPYEPPRSEGDDYVGDTDAPPRLTHVPYGSRSPRAEKRAKTATPSAASAASAPTTAPTVTRVLPVLAAAVGVVVAVGVVLMGFVSSPEVMSGGAGSSVGEAPVLEQPVAPRVLSSAGLADLVEAVRAETGSSEVFGATLYPTYAVLDVPVDPTSQRERSLYWDGTLRESSSRGTASEGRIDLADVQPQVLDTLLRKARRLVEEPMTWYVIVEGPSTTTDDSGIRLRAYANNQYQEVAYVAARLDGTVVRTYSSVEGG